MCPNCGHDRGCQLTTHKLQQCYRCHRQTSITAGTIFEATKLPLTVWFQALYLMTQDKKGCSAMKLHRHLGISYNAAWRMRHKLMQVMMERDRAHPLGGSVQLDDAYLGGERSGGKRGRGAPGIALVVTPQGFPLAYEVMPGNTSDKTTLKDFLKQIEAQYGRSDRVWIMDRGIPTEETLEQMRIGDSPVHYLARLRQLTMCFGDFRR